MLGDQPVQIVSVETNSAQARVYEAMIKLNAGQNRVRAVVRRVKEGLAEAEALRWKSGPGQRGAGFVQWLEIEGPLTVETVLPETHRRVFYTDSQIGTDREVARDILTRFARRAY